ncbi:hypothetical protein C0Q70_07499 [Pomacea canaliculata]|uniref:Calpain catalytic domain-containing protein n=1 Tax=Pomacea canaliculata TaxID=400727 RepID=A0A2T7PF70_POMCA|nr:hypothetical protein C0Q70_07499 [Pomacea canaliculata]
MHALQLKMNDKKERRKSASSSSGAQLAAARRVRETPYQDICRIRRTILALRDAKGSLSSDDYFVDPSFAPDMTSLAYVYSGDDKYERTIFQRPHETQDDPVFVGVGGVCDEPFPWRQWKLRQWFHAALVTVSLSLKHLEKIIPGYKNFEQGFSKDYTGAFHFNIWRFGEWVDIVVDDRMPMLDGRHLFCGPMGSAQELWGPLVEKAYAKCKKTFQSIEYGHTLDALTDLTGAVCEHFSPDVRPPSNLFRILLKSHLARSMMVCWRNDKRLTPTGFTVDSELQENQNLRYLHVITAVTKFPTTDGRLVEMIRLKCPFPGEARWQGKFSDRDSASWDSVNRDFMDRLQPLTKKDDDEYWVAMEDFRCNFGGLFVVSSPEPFRVDGLSLARCYHLPPAMECWEPNSGLASPDLASTNGLQRRGSAPKPDDTVGRLLDSDTLSLARRRASHASMVPLRHDERHGHSKRGSDKQETEVKTPSSSRSKGSSASSPTGSFPRSAHSLAHSDSSASATTSPSIKTTSVFTFPAATEFTSHHPHQHRSGTASASASAPPHSAKCKPRTPTKKSRGSISNQSDSGSAHSSSEISLQFKPTMHAANLGGGSAAGGSGGGDGASGSGCFGRVMASEDRRPHSAPQTNLARHFSSNSLSSLTQGHFRATKADYFRSEGRWRLMLEAYDKWTRSKPSSSRANLDLHSRSQRHHFQVTRLEGPDELSPPTLQGKRHVIVSLVQDYRHGAITANSLLVPIGFCLYRSKGTEKDDKRHISKFQLLDQIQGEPEMREVNARFDLEPGSYFLVPFYNSDSHEGEYLLRILTEESLHIKTGW